MTEFQALITGAVHGALLKASAEGRSGEGPFLIDAEIQVDGHGNYTNEIVVKGRESGEELLVTITPRYDTPESVAEKMQGAHAVMEAAQRHLG